MDDALEIAEQIELIVWTILERTITCSMTLCKRLRVTCITFFDLVVG